MARCKSAAGPQDSAQVLLIRHAGAAVFSYLCENRLILLPQYGNGNILGMASTRYPGRVLCFLVPTYLGTCRPSYPGAAGTRVRVRTWVVQKVPPEVAAQRVGIACCRETSECPHLE